MILRLVAGNQAARVSLNARLHASVSERNIIEFSGERLSADWKLVHGIRFLKGLLRVCIKQF